MLHVRRRVAAMENGRIRRSLTSGVVTEDDLTQAIPGIGDKAA